MSNLFINLLGLVRFSHTIFALPFAFASATLAWKAEGFVRWTDAVGILLCMVFARSFAMAVNRILDRDIDAKNPRTKNRHIPAGLLPLRTVWLFAVVCVALFLASCMLFLTRTPSNPWPLTLSIPVLGFVAGYTLAKRFTSLAHFWLGVALMLAPLAAWIAIRGVVKMQEPALLAGAVMFWVAGFDLLYACQDAEFDKHEGLHSIPARFGVKGALRIAAICHAITIGFLFALGLVSPSLGIVYQLGIGAVAVLLAYEHWLVRPNDLTRVNQAFFTVNAIISMGILVLIVIEVLVN